MLDDYCKAILRVNINMAVPWYLMAGYAYEIEDDPIISDSAWDWLCQTIQDNWQTIQHPHKHYIDFDTLSTATASGIKEENLPPMVIYGLKAVREMAALC